MELKLVSFELAKKLKEIGFDYNCIYAWYKKGGWNKYTRKHDPVEYILRTDGNPFGSYFKGKNWNVNKNNKNIICSAQTLELAKMWFRNEHNLVINVDWHNYDEDDNYKPLWTVDLSKINQEDWIVETESLEIETFESYEDALKAGLLKACKLIKK